MRSPIEARDLPDCSAAARTWSACFCARSASLSSSDFCKLLTCSWSAATSRCNSRMLLSAQNTAGATHSATANKRRNMPIHPPSIHPTAAGLFLHREGPVVENRWAALEGNLMDHFEAGPQPADTKNPSRDMPAIIDKAGHLVVGDRKSTRRNSSHLVISYAVFCLKKKKKKIKRTRDSQCHQEYCSRPTECTS